MRLTKLCLLCSSLATTAAFAGRPLVTEDAGLLERGSCELEAFASHLTERDQPSLRGESVQLACGVGASTQLALATAQLRADAGRERSVVLSGKTLVHTRSAGTALALAWALTGVKSPGGSFEHETTAVNGVISHPTASDTRLHLNLGWSRTASANASSTNWAAAIEHSSDLGVDLLAEVFASDRDRSPWVQLAVRWPVVPERFFLDASWGVQTVSSRPRLLTIGLKFAF